MNDYREFDYDWHQAANIFWTCGEASTQMSISVEISLVLLTLAALTFFGLNLMVSTRDVMLVVSTSQSESKAKPSWLKPNPLPIFLQIRFTERRYRATQNASGLATARFHCSLSH